MFGRKKDKREEFYNKKSQLSSRLHSAGVSFGSGDPRS